MGGGGSQTINQTFNMDVLNKSIFTQITTNQQTLSASMNNIQKIKIFVGEMGPKCEIDLTQDIDANSQSSAVMEPHTIASAKDVVTTELTASAQAAIEKATELGNLQFGDKQNMNQEVTMSLQNVIDKTFETNNLNEVISEVINVQEGGIEIRKCNGKINLNQNIVAVLMAEAITKSLTSAISDNETLSSLAASTSGSQRSENKGLSDLVGTLFEGLTGPMKYGIIASVVCCCLLVLVMIVIGLSPAGQSATKNLGAAGAARLGSARRF